MILADLHTHTCYSHGATTPEEMYAAALDKGMTLLGFTEHSPRPEGFNYTHEYRDQLTAHMPDYIGEVRALRASPRSGSNGPCEVLLGQEMDWLEGQLQFTEAACRAYDYDYLLGSVHFLGTWGFDDVADAWEGLSQEECDKIYEAYFSAWNDMIASGLFQIASHPDLIKIFSVDQFHIWLNRHKSQELLKESLYKLKTQGMAMEISSAGLRKPCQEIYPAPLIMSLAAQCGVDVSFASDAHAPADIGYAFPRLATYAQAFGFKNHIVVRHGRKEILPLS
ncbi:MAG: histidinol-phosphatase [Desulfovibrio sp.]|nr:histidinol-phosphatase [Desulfovibrio sp.]